MKEISLFDRMLLNVAPGVAAGRAKKQLEAKNYYEAAKIKKRDSYRPRYGNSDPNSALQAQGHILVDKARYLERNFDLAGATLGLMVNKVVGNGIRCEPKVRLTNGELAEDLNKFLCVEHEKWCERPEVARSLSHYDAQRLAVKSKTRDGEIFVQLVSKDTANHTHPVGLSYELIETDYVPMHLHTSASDDNQIYNGIERNEWGAPIWYHVLRQTAFERLKNTGETRRISQANMLHLMHANRAKQGRGETAFASFSNRFSDLKEYEDFERIAARFAACFVGSIEKDAESSEFSDNTTTTNADEFSLTAGSLWDGRADGSKLQVHAPNRPNNGTEAFRKLNLDSIAARLGLPSGPLSKNWGGNYSAQRQEMVETHIGIQAMQDEFISQFERPMWRRWMLAAQANSFIPDELLIDVDMATIDAATFHGPQMPWIDPLKEFRGYEVALENGFMDLETIIHRLGLDPREVQANRTQTTETPTEGVNDA